MKPNAVLYLFSPRIDPFVKVSTDLCINSVMMGISQNSL